MQELARESNSSRSAASANGWHANRHTFCSWLAMAEASIKEVAQVAQK